MEPLSAATHYCTAESVKMSTGSSVTLCSATTVVVVGLISYLIFKFSARFKIWVISKVTKSFEITGVMDPHPRGIYRYTLDWLEQNVPGWTHQEVTAHSKRDDDGRVTTYFKKPPGFETSPHYFKHEGAWIQLTRKRLAEIGISDGRKPVESITFRTLSYNGVVLTKILTNIHSQFEDVEPDETKTKFYYRDTCDRNYWGEFAISKRKRPLNSVILNEATVNNIINDIQEFRDSENWYCDRGIPYRRGYLLYGPSGNGKSSLVRAIAGKFDYNICILLLSEDMKDDDLNNLMNSAPKNSIILVEDIDAAFPSRDIVDDDDDKKSKKDLRSPEGEASSGKVTLRGLLNSLDGVATADGRIVFFTTNCVDRLDSAVTRPGRVDMKIMIALPNDNQLERMFTKFYPDAPETDQVEFVKVIRGLNKPVSMAMIQSLFLFHKESHSDVITSAVQYFDEQFFSLASTNS